MTHLRYLPVPLHHGCRLGVPAATLALALLVGGCGSDVLGPDAPRSFIALGVGAEHACGVGPDGRAFCWGAGEYRQLGRESTEDSPVPVLVEGSQAYTAVTAGYSHTCGLTIDGSVYCWGSNVQAQLGTGSTSGVLGPSAIAGEQRFTAISAGWYHTCGIANGGQVYCWGEGGQGQLGNGGTGPQTVPVAVAGGLRFQNLSAGAHHTCAITVDRQAYCWGLNHVGQLGSGSTAPSSVPVAVAGGGQYASIGAGVTHTCAGRPDGTLLCWGSNVHGEMGNGAIEREGLPGATTPSTALGPDGLKVVAAGRHYSCGVLPGGQAFCWGYGLDGQLGNGFQLVHAVPQRLAAPSGSGSDQLVVKAMGAGLTHACALTTANSIFCWGDSRRGALGSPAVRQSVLPVMVRRGS